MSFTRNTINFTERFGKSIGICFYWFGGARRRTRGVNPLPSNSQETVLLQIEDDKPTVFTPKALKWDEITIADEIELQEPHSSAQIERRDVDQIIEEPDGRVILKFQSLSCREDPSLPNPSNSSNFRRSFSECSSQTGNLDQPQRYRFQSPIPEPIIDPPSPSSSGIGNTINTITKLDFTINWPVLKIDYYSEKHSTLRKWFEVINFDLREQIKKEWIADMERLRVSIPFFLWFPTFTSKYGLPEIYSQPSLNVQNILFKIWPSIKINNSHKNHDNYTTAYSNIILLNKIQQQLDALSNKSYSTPCKTSNQNPNIETKERKTVNKPAKEFTNKIPLAINKISCENSSPNPLSEKDDIPSSSFKAPLTKGKELNGRPKQNTKEASFQKIAPSLSLTNIGRQIPSPNPVQKINQIKGEIKHLKNEVIKLKTNDLTFEAKLAPTQKSSKFEVPKTTQIAVSNIPKKQSTITFQN